MLRKEIPLYTPKTKLWHIVILLTVCIVVAAPSGADDAASGIVDSQTFLRRNMAPAGPPASASAAAPEKLHKAVGEYGVGSILNVNDEALSVERWHEIIHAIQAEAKKSRLQIPVLYGIDTIH